MQGALRSSPRATNDHAVIERAVAGCDGVLGVLAPWGVQHYASGTAQAVLDHAPAEARLVFSCGWHISRDGRDVYSRWFRWKVGANGLAGSARSGRGSGRPGRGVSTRVRERHAV